MQNRFLQLFKTKLTDQLLEEGTPVNKEIKSSQIHNHFRSAGRAVVSPTSSQNIQVLYRHKTPRQMRLTPEKYNKTPQYRRDSYCIWPNDSQSQHKMLHQQQQERDVHIRRHIIQRRDNSQGDWVSTRSIKPYGYSFRSRSFKFDQYN